MTVRILLGDCLQKLQLLQNNSVDAVVTDPPYGLSFMGKKWDYDVPSVAIWEQCLRVLKPGGHLLAFAGTRTQHRMAVRIEDAGFEIRDMIAWVYGSGFPKSLDVSKAIDKAAGAERERYQRPAFGGTFSDDGGTTYGTAISDTPATPEAQRWQGWGTALKPALEPITVARKPLSGTVAETVLQHGTGALNVDGCRVETSNDLNGGRYSNNKQGDDGNSYGRGINKRSENNYTQPAGRWPANLIHDGSNEVTGLFPNTSSGKMRAGTQRSNTSGWAGPMPEQTGAETYGDSGSAARFFYCAKSSKKDRGEGNNHPTVKPTDLMRYLCRLVTPPKGIVLDPYMGSGSTGRAAVLEGFSFIGIEMNAEYYAIARTRIKSAKGVK